MTATAKTHPRLRGFGDSVFTRMSALARQYDAVNLGQGFPDFPGPEFVKDAAKAAIDADLNQYAISAGAPRLRQQIALDLALDELRGLPEQDEKGQELERDVQDGREHLVDAEFLVFFDDGSVGHERPPIRNRAARSSCRPVFTGKPCAG